LDHEGDEPLWRDGLDGEGHEDVAILEKNAVKKVW